MQDENILTEDGNIKSECPYCSCDVFERPSSKFIRCHSCGAVWNKATGEMDDEI